ncbi:hypothetical protein, partial [Staphylococcus pettenkoferi]|uniref:hypothetical protein n=1 Tax=Staphylococcus pettenkoferi TaxID=170573 RepID=UPI001C92EF5D
MKEGKKNGIRKKGMKSRMRERIGECCKNGKGLIGGMKGIIRKLGESLVRRVVMSVSPKGVMMG